MEQHCRIPAFGEWNYGRYDYGVDGWTPLTPCFDAVGLRMTDALPASKPDVERTRARGHARRPRRIPAFGEWNHNSDDANGSWLAAATPFFDLAAAHKPPVKERKDGVAEAKQRRSAEAHGRRRSKVADSGAYAARKSCFTVVAAKAVDDDLYGVPADMLYQKPERKRGWLRILLVAGCFCPGGGRTCMA